MTKYTKEELEIQRDEILSEFNYHKVLEFGERMQEGQSLPFIDYASIASIRKELKEAIDSFIVAYGSEDVDGVFSDGKWKVSLTWDYDGPPVITAAFEFQVMEQDAIGCREKE